MSMNESVTWFLRLFLSSFLPHASWSLELGGGVVEGVGSYGRADSGT